MSYIILTVPGEDEVSVAPSVVSISETTGHHDLATVVMDDESPLIDRLGEPCVLSVVDGANVKRMVGYIDTFTKGSQLDSHQYSYYILGATSVMRSGAPRVWRDQRPFDIAKEIVSKYELALEFDSYSYKLPMFTQTVESDWEALRSLASECGFFLFGNNTTIRMVNPIMEIRRQMRNLLPQYQAPTGGGTYQTLGNFTKVNTKSPIGYENTEFTGIDRHGSSFSVTANTGATVTKKSSLLSQSLSEAQAAADRVTARSFMEQRATMTLSSGVLLSSGSCVSIKQPESQDVWLINDITHMVNTQGGSSSYSTVATVCRSTKADTVPAPYRDVSSRPSNALVNRRWRSEQNWMVEL